MRKFLTLAAAAAAVMLGASAHAVPTLIITLSDTGSAATATCSITSTGLQGCGAGFGVGGGNGVGNLEGLYTGTLGGYSVSFTTSQTNTPGLNSGAEINISFNSVLNKFSTGSLILSVAAHDFTLPAGPLLTLTGSQALSANLLNPGSVVSNYYVSATNVPKASTAATATTSAAAATGTATALNAPAVNWMRNPTMFSMEAIVAFTLTMGNITGLNGSSNMESRNRVPEPMTTALVGLGLFGAAFFSRRRKAVTA